MFTNTLLQQVLEYVKPPQTLLLDTFFGGPPDVSNTAEVSIDIVTRKRALAPFVSPLVQAPLMERRGFATNTFRPPYIKQKFPYQPGDFLLRMAGELVSGFGVRPGDRMLKRIAEDTMDAMDYITRRQEWMAMQALTAGTVAIVGEGVGVTLDFGLPASHKVVLSSPNLWSESTGKPIRNLKTWRRVIQQDSGNTPSVLVMGSEAADAFLDNAEVVKELDRYRPAQSDIRLQAGQDSGATFFGALPSAGISEIWQYDEFYIDPSDSTEKALMPAKSIILGSRRSRCTRHYGAIQDVAAGFIPVEVWPKTWEENDPSVRWSMFQSAPLPIPHEVMSFLTAQVVP